ncbi:GntR family transcriptional regulator [Rhodococcus sp. BP-316]|uniref:GntR family transcriptional regulator n=1 Tax=unclassified Rhodococcus (in: high G+C Gram-positive bacteria) TaxID=192944 RepID=UPI0006F1E27D|nr:MULTISPECIES: GntR family transcriptional regulator [unclassified Rhodococcus (in: high G+C Gram-positive bacteria)]KQU28536.1 GntR family transcriptional regulator [Rhodococcus sp. Leaf225]KQU47548.1 GntR family transcriptional regulator [Rhodococcus sp. Leaf258]MBY6682893.1 GntR family transcriptional regulator [Rhodococcus sp. BP-316]
MAVAQNVFSSKGDVAYAQLRSWILLGTLPAGSRLAQYELADRLQMSITPLREAVRRLSSEGLIELDSHKNVRIAPMSATQARQLFEVRLSLDPTAVELAAQRRTERDIVDMRAAASRLVPVTQKWGEEGLIAHREFHRTLYLASHNDVLIHLLEDLWDKSDRYRRVGLELPPGAEPRTIDLDEHFQILELVVSGDSHAAGELTRKHILNSLTAAAIDALEGDELTHHQDSA